MRATPDQWNPHWAVHPGEHLAACIGSHGLSRERFARVTDIPVETIDAIIGGQHPITLDIAIRIERSLGIMPDLWFILQSKWHRQQKAS
ncbi:helix-turn-helix transcriptional regulator [Phyllobacterium sp. 22229]|uniref:helix-turn-helix transcriptional regulator n=1 Tax=Phyllobacterium sp. 22229 TaxID=3453895 RepID=UPI003F856676